MKNGTFIVFFSRLTIKKIKFECQTIFEGQKWLFQVVHSLGCQLCSEACRVCLVTVRTGLPSANLNHRALKIGGLDCSLAGNKPNRPV